MGIKKIGILFFAILLATQLAGQSNIVRHTVQAGETIFGIAKQYNISQDELIKYNPDISAGLTEGAILVIPQVEKTANTPPPNIQYIEHIVKPQETVYGLCKKYNCTEVQLLELNPQIKHGLQIGDRIKIPKVAIKTIISADSSNFIYHKVEPKETVYSISKAAQISQEEFLKLNPEVTKNGLQIGQTVRWPKEKSVQPLTEDLPTDKIEKNKEKSPREYGLYRVVQGDDAISIAAKYSTSVDELIRLNPEMADAVTVGRYIVVPKKASHAEQTAVPPKPEDLFWMTPDTAKLNTVRLALCIPLYVSGMYPEELDSSLSEGGNVLKKAHVALQFMAGFKLAVDTLSGLGYNIKVSVFDTENDEFVVRKIAQNIDGKYDAVIGPLYAKNAELLASLLPNMPIVSPLSKTVNNTNLPNLINAVAGIKSEYKKIALLLNQKSHNSQVLFINTDTPENQKVVNEINTYLYAKDSITYRRIWVDEGYELLQNLSSYLHPNKNNILVVVDQDAAFISDLLTKVYNRNDSSVFILATSKMFGIQTLETEYLNNQRFAGVANTYIDYTDTATQLFVKKYRSKVGTEPSKYAFSGYDVGLYFAQLVSANQSLPEPKYWPKTQGLSRGFWFEHSNVNGTYNNYTYALHLLDFVYTVIK